MALLSTLEAFVASGSKPAPTAVAAIWKDVPGLDQAFTPLPWRGTAS
jgi:hypothetical protein